MKNWIVFVIFAATAPLFVMPGTAQDKPAVQQSEAEKPSERHVHLLSRSSRIATKTGTDSSALITNRAGLKQTSAPNLSGTPVRVQRSWQSSRANVLSMPSSSNVRHRGSNQPVVTGAGNSTLRNIAVNGTEVHKRR